MESSIKILNNQLEFKDVASKAFEGVSLNEEEKQYLLPQFLMLLVGKPGSGKTTLLKQLVLNEQMYHDKFNYILLVSPSHSKMGLKIKKEYVKEDFSLQWIFSKFDKINQEQMEKIFGHSYGGKNLSQGQTTNIKQRAMKKSFVIGDLNSRFFVTDFLKKYNLNKHDQTPIASESERKKMEMDKLYKEVSKMPFQKQKETHVNVLLILDDVVGQIKKEETNPLLAQLVMNRRHVVLNGTVSIIIVTQKYTLIPARVRSSASWLILFNLNPIDFENVYHDSSNETLSTWRNILSFVFGTRFDKTAPKNQKQQQQIDKEQESVQQQQQSGFKTSEEGKESIDEYMKKKKYENLGIWIEFGLYFKNFKRLII